MINTKKVTGRRPVRYTHLEDILTDAERIASGPYRTLGNWSLGQIVEHIAKAMDTAFDKSDFRAPWVLRVFVAPLVKNQMLIKPMPAGFKLPKSAKTLIPDPLEIQPALEHLKKSIERFETQTPTQKHGFFGDLAPQEWVSLMLRHAEMHMSFVVPA